MGYRLSIKLVHITTALECEGSYHNRIADKDKARSTGARQSRPKSRTRHRYSTTPSHLESAPSSRKNDTCVKISRESHASGKATARLTPDGLGQGYSDNPPEIYQRSPDGASKSPNCENNRGMANSPNEQFVDSSWESPQKLFNSRIFPLGIDPNTFSNRRRDAPGNEGSQKSKRNKSSRHESKRANATQSLAGVKKAQRAKY